MTSTHSTLIATVGPYDLRHSDGTQDWPGFSTGGLARGYWFGTDMHREHIANDLDAALTEIRAQAEFMGLTAEIY